MYELSYSEIRKTDSGKPWTVVKGMVGARSTAGVLGLAAVKDTDRDRGRSHISPFVCRLRGQGARGASHASP